MSEITGYGYFYAPLIAIAVVLFIAILTTRRGVNHTQQPKKETPEEFECYEIWRPNIPDYGCNTQCKECKKKQMNERFDNTQ